MGSRLSLVGDVWSLTKGRERRGWLVWVGDEAAFFFFAML